MPRLTLDELLKVTATDVRLFKQLRARKQLAMAFGRSDAYVSLSYVALDGVGFMLADALAKSHGRKFAAQVVRVYWDVWGMVTAYAAADPSKAANFCIVDFRTADGKAAHMVCGASGEISAEYIALELASTPQAAGAEADRIVCVNVSRLVRFMIDQGARNGINLLGAFLPPPDDPRTIDLIKPGTVARQHALEVIEAIKAGDEKAAAKAGLLARSAIEAMFTIPSGATLQ